MEEDIIGGMELTVPQVGEVSQIAESMVVMGPDKALIELDTQDRHELAVLFMVKGGMSGLTKRAKEFEDKAKEVGAPWMLARGVKTVKVPGIGAFSLTEGTNVSISADSLRKVLIGHLSAPVVGKIIEEVTKRTTYTTLQFKADAKRVRGAE